MNRRKRARIGVTVLVFLALVLLLARLYLPVWLTDYVNNVLDNIPGYTGQVEDIDVHLYRGAYVINGLRLDKTGEDVPVPFLRIARSDLSIQWGALLKGRIVSDLHLTGAEINVVVNNGRSVQTGEDVDWTLPIQELMPIDINHVVINDSRLTYHNYAADPVVNLYVNDLQGEVTNLRNVVRQNEALPSRFHLTGRSIGGGRLSAHGNMDILLPTPDLDMTISLEDAKLTAINDLANEHAGLDFVSGNLSIYSELVVKQRQVRGYIKPLATDIQVTSLRQDDNPIEYLWESLASIVMELLENQPADQFATKIPFEGRLDEVNTHNWQAFVAILRNAFVQAFSHSPDNSIRFLGLEAEPEKKSGKKGNNGTTSNEGEPAIKNFEDQPIPLGIRKH